MGTPSFDVKILVEKVRIIRGYLRYFATYEEKYVGLCFQASTKRTLLAFQASTC